ncbi:hypothetical protein HHX47_DHR2000395 [Lentinula edodes]|nr:hypothetical protein HHX47_DHR2000395 [Lentinula edodes]
MAHSTPTNWSIQFLSTVSSDTDPCVVFSFEQGPDTVQGSGGGAKYIFNVGENTNRAFTQSKMSWNGTRAVFLTGVGRGMAIPRGFSGSGEFKGSPRDRVGGLSSLLMSFADGDPKYPVKVIGPPGVNHLLATQRSFVYRKNISVLSTELPFNEFVTERRSPEPIFQDGNLTVYGIPITPIYLDVAAAPLAASNDLKRKRVGDDATNIVAGANADDFEGHEEPPRKRVQVTKEALDMQDSNIIMSDASVPPIPLANLLSTPSFTPESLSTLTPAQAQEWREMMVAIMFPRSKGVELPATNNSEQSKYAKGKAIPVPNSSSSIDSATLPSTSTSTSSPSSSARRSWNYANKSYVSKFSVHTGPGTRNGGEEEEKEEPDEYRRPMLVTGFHKQLPRFSLSENQKALPPSALSLSYLAVGPLTRGKFDARKAEELGVPDGPLRGALTRGETVRFLVDNNGRAVRAQTHGKGKKKKKGPNAGIVVDANEGERWVTVRPEDVVAPSIPPAAALILDIPTPEYIPSLLEAFREGSAYAQWCGYSPVASTIPTTESQPRFHLPPEQQENQSQQAQKETQFTLHTIIHLIGDGVLEDPRYRAFMAGFERVGTSEAVPANMDESAEYGLFENELKYPGVHPHHVISSPSYLPDPVTFTSSAYQQLKLAQLDPKMFRVPKFGLVPRRVLEEDMKEEEQGEKEEQDTISIGSQIPPSPELPKLPKNTTLLTAHSIIPMRPLGPPQKEDWAAFADTPQGEEWDRFHPAVAKIRNRLLAEAEAESYRRGSESRFRSLSGSTSGSDSDSCFGRLLTGSADSVSDPIHTSAAPTSEAEQVLAIPHTSAENTMDLLDTLNTVDTPALDPPPVELRDDDDGGGVKSVPQGTATLGSAESWESDPGGSGGSIVTTITIAGGENGGNTEDAVSQKSSESFTSMELKLLNNSSTMLNTNADANGDTSTDRKPSSRKSGRRARKLAPDLEREREGKSFSLLSSLRELLRKEEEKGVKKSGGKNDSEMDGPPNPKFPNPKNPPLKVSRLKIDTHSLHLPLKNNPILKQRTAIAFRYARSLAWRYEKEMAEAMERLDMIEMFQSMKAAAEKEKQKDKEEGTSESPLSASESSKLKMPLDQAILNALEARELNRLRYILKGWKGRKRSVFEEKEKKNAGRYVSVITLGTVSATVIQIPEWGNILLDCGEGTWGQLCRVFGTASSTHTPTTSSSLSQSPEEQTLGVDAFLRSLKLIYISHLHADHHLGLAKILAMRQALNPPPKDPVYLVGVRGVHLYLREVCDLEGLGIEGVDVDRGKGNGVITVLSPALHWNYSQVYTPQGMWSVGGTEEWLDSKTSRGHITVLCRALNLHSFTTVDVRHRTRCYGCIIHSKDGWSIVFSGDTMPSDNLVHAAKNVIKGNPGREWRADQKVKNEQITLLIHEATMSDAQADMAAAKAHSTVGQAIDIGRRMGAENVLLTHFSARQPKMPHRVFVGGRGKGRGGGRGGYRGGQGRGTGDIRPDNDESTLSSFFPVSPEPTPYITTPYIATAFDYAHFTLGSMWKMQFYMDGIEQSYREMVEEERDTVEERMVEEEWEEIREQEDMRVKADERESWMMGGYEQESGMELGMDLGEEAEAEQMESDRELKQVESYEEDEKINDYP